MLLINLSLVLIKVDSAVRAVIDGIGAEKAGFLPDAGIDVQIAFAARAAQHKNTPRYDA